MSNNGNELSINFDSFIKLGYGIIDIRVKDYEITHDKYKYVITRIEGDRDSFYQDMLKYYLGRDLIDKNVYEIWVKVLMHKINMSEDLKRDVSIKVAAIDYLENNNH
jgi:hypothetical protein